MVTFSKFFALAVLAGAMPALAAERPPITGIATFTVKVADLEEARRFYNGVVGMEEAFRTRDASGAEVSVFKVNDRQFVEVSPTLVADEDRLIRIGFETRDARKLRDYLAEKGVKVPAKAGKDAHGNRSFEVQDPDGHTVQFIEYLPGSVHRRAAGKHLAAARISDHMVHVGVRVVDPAKADAFYKDILGFRLQWKGGMTDTKIEWISMMVPDGHDWLEYMVREAAPAPQQLGVLNHYCLETLDIQKVHQTVMKRGYKPPRDPSVGRDGRWLLHLYDKNFTRTEVMVRKPVEKPCCSPNLDDIDEPAKPSRRR